MYFRISQRLARHLHKVAIDHAWTHHLICVQWYAYAIDAHLYAAMSMRHGVCQTISSHLDHVPSQSLHTFFLSLPLSSFSLQDPTGPPKCLCSRSPYFIVTVLWRFCGCLILVSFLSVLLSGRRVTLITIVSSPATTPRCSNYSTVLPFITIFSLRSPFGSVDVSVASP